MLGVCACIILRMWQFFHNMLCCVTDVENANLLHVMVVGSLAFTNFIPLVGHQQENHCKPANDTPPVSKGSLETFAISLTKPCDPRKRH